MSYNTDVAVGVESDSVFDACCRMKVTRVSAIVVCDTAGSVQGIVTERDVLRKVAHKGLDPTKLILGQVMTRHPTCVPVAACDNVKAMETMARGRFRHLPVVIDEVSRVLVGLYDSLLLGKAILQTGSKGLLTRTRLFMKSFFTKWSGQSAGLALALSTACDTNGVVTVESSAVVREAVATMSAQGSSAVLVRDPEVDGVSGIFTERDLLARVLAAGLNPDSTPLATVMTLDPDAVSTSASVEDALTRMTEKHYRHLPVVDSEGVVVGMMDVAQLLQSVTGIKAAPLVRTPPPKLPPAAHRDDAPEVAPAMSPPLVLMSAVSPTPRAATRRQRTNAAAASGPTVTGLLPEQAAALDRAVGRARQGRNQMLQMNFHGANTRFTLALDKLAGLEPAVAAAVGESPSQAAFEALATVQALQVQVLSQRADSVGFDGRPHDAAQDLEAALGRLDAQLDTVQRAAGLGFTLVASKAATRGGGTPVCVLQSDVRDRLLSEVCAAYVQCGRFGDVGAAAGRIDATRPSGATALRSALGSVRTEVDNLAEAAEELIGGGELHDALRSLGMALDATAAGEALAGAFPVEAGEVPPCTQTAASLLSQRAGVHLKLLATAAALEDARNCLARDPVFVPGYVTLAEALVEGGNIIDGLVAAGQGLGVATSAAVAGHYSVDQHVDHAALQRVQAVCVDALRLDAATASTATGDKENVRGSPVPGKAAAVRAELADIALLLDGK